MENAPVNKQPTLAELGLDDAVSPDPFGRALDGYVATPDEFEPSWVDRIDKRQEDFSPGVAAVLSFMVPGAGQVYRQRLLEGFAWLFIVAIAYVISFAWLPFIIVALILHLCCAVMATVTD